MCSNCDTARQYPQHRWFDPACVWCGARIIQYLGTLPILASECTSRRFANLQIWLAHGHSEAQIRTLAKGPPSLAPLPLSPTTQATPAVSGRQAKVKCR